MNRINFSLVYNRKNQLLKDGTASVFICAYLNGKRKYISTDVKLFPNQWDIKRTKVKSNVANYLERNTYLYGLIEKLEAFELDRINKKLPIDLDCLDEFFDAENNVDRNNFLLFFQKALNENKTIKKSTKGIYETTYKHLVSFKKKIYFSDLDYQFLKRFEAHLLNGGMNINTAGKYLRYLKAIINLAINYGYFDLNKYPFRTFKIKTQSTKRTFLTPSEITKLENLHLSDAEGLRTIRDLFLFSSYTGLRFSDVMALTPKNLVEIEGKQYLVLNMEKTKESLRIPIYLLFNSKPLEILERYEPINTNHVYFANSTNQHINRVLKVLANMAGINKKLTFHCARHTAATYLLYKGVPIVVVKKLLGHKKLATTEIYAKVMNITVDNELSKAFS